MQVGMLGESVYALSREGFYIDSALYGVSVEGTNEYTIEEVDMLGFENPMVTVLLVAFLFFLYKVVTAK